MYCLDIGTLLWHLLCFVILSHWRECYFNLHIHKRGPWGTKYHFWQPVLIEKCQKAKISCVPLFSSQKTCIIIFQNSQEIVNFIPIYFESLRTHNLDKDRNFLWISPLQVKLRNHMSSWNTWNLSFLEFFWVKLVAKNSVWVPRGPLTLFILNCFQVAEIQSHLIVSKR